MIGFAALAQSGHTGPPAFNADFYVAAATVIPVLFLAIAVQGSTYADLLRAATGALQLDGQHHEYAPGRLGMLVAAVVSLTSTCLVIVIPASGVVGEIMALMSLDAGYVKGDQTVVLVAAVILTIAAAVGPVAALGNALPPPEPGTAPRRHGQETRPATPAETEKPPD